MKSNYNQLGQYIEMVSRTNSDLKYGIEDVRGCSNTKQMMQTRANLIGRTYEKFIVLRPQEFVFNRRTTRNGEKIGMAYNNTDREYIFTNDYVAFRVKQEYLDKLLPDYLYMFFCRDEFDRYARYKSTGSATEFFNWEDMCAVPFEIPPMDFQQLVVNAYKVLNERIETKQKINDNLVSTLQIIYKKMFLESQNTYITKPLADLCSKIGSGATPKGGKAAYFDKGISLIRSMNVFDYFFSYPELAHISQIQANALANVEIQQADVLFNITGVSVTRCCVVPDDVLPARVNQHVMIIRPYKGKNMSYYIMCTLCTSENKAKLLGIGQSGSTREAINKQELESFEIPVPSDEKLESFGKIATKIYAFIFSNTNEIRMLCDMKDTLLHEANTWGIDWSKSCSKLWKYR